MLSTTKDRQVPHQGRTDGQDTKVAGEQNTSLVGNADSEEYHDVIGFRSAGEAIQNESIGPKEIDDLLASLKSNEQTHDIKSFLARPTLIDTFQPSEAVKELARYKVLSTLRSHANFKNHRAKLAGFYGIKMTVNLKIVINPQPFQSGIFLLYFVPGNDFNNPKQLHMDDGIHSLPYATGCPHVILNVATQSEATLSIPYVGTMPFIDLTRIQSDQEEAFFGSFKVRPIVQLADSTSAPKCEAASYMWFTDVELFGATENVFRPQMERNQQVRQRQKEADPFTRIVSTVEKLVPLLGLSKPNATPDVTRFYAAPTGSMANFNANDVSFKMALDSQQNVKVSQMGLTTNDEMDIANYVSMPGYLSYFKWTTSTTQGSKLFESPVEPNTTLYDDYTPIKDRTIQRVYPNRLRYAANLFSYWRGAIRFTFHVAATKFHSGRLRIVYSLGDAASNDHPGMSKYSYIIDIRDGMEFTIEFPYISPQLWKSVPDHWNDDKKIYTQGTNHKSFVNHGLSRMQVFVETPLINSPSTSSDVFVAVFTSGGPDIQFSVPVWPTSVPETSSAYAVSPEIVYKAPEERGGDKETVFQPQGLIEDDRQIVDITTGRPSTVTKKSLPSELSVGEVVTNFRQLLRRYYPIDEVLLAKGKTDANISVMFNPFQFLRRGESYPDVCRTGEPLIYLIGTYMYYRGGMRFIVTTTKQIKRCTVVFNPANHQLPLSKIAQPKSNGLLPLRKIKFESNNVTLTDPLSYLARPSCQAYNVDSGGAAAFEIPFYSRVDKAIAGWYPPSDDDSYEYARDRMYAPDGSVVLVFDMAQDKDDSEYQMTVFRSTADDFSFGYATGPPPTDTNVYCTADITVGR